MEKKTCGVIYILENPSFKEYVKIGYADNLESRLKQLNNSECIPFAFRAYAVCEVEKRLADIDVHNIFDRLNPDLRSKEMFNGKERKREFFAIDAESAYQILLSVASIFSSPDRVKRIAPTKEETKAELIAAENTQRSELRTEFWQGLSDYYKAKDDLFNNVNMVGHYTWCSAGMGGNQLTFYITLSSVSVLLTAKKELFDKLYSDKSRVEKLFSCPLNWKLEKREIEIKNTEMLFKQTETWQEIFKFMTDTMLVLKKLIKDEMPAKTEKIIQPITDKQQATIERFISAASYHAGEIGYTITHTTQDGENEFGRAGKFLTVYEIAPDKNGKIIRRVLIAKSGGIYSVRYAKDGHSYEWTGFNDNFRDAVKYEGSATKFITNSKSAGISE